MQAPINDPIISARKPVMTHLLLSQVLDVRSWAQTAPTLGTLLQVLRVVVLPTDEFGARRRTRFELAEEEEDGNRVQSRSRRRDSQTEVPILALLRAEKVSADWIIP
jgi:hypothetical protein